MGLPTFDLGRYFPGLGRRLFVVGSEVKAETLEAGDIASGAVGESELATGAVTGVKIVDRAIGVPPNATEVEIDHAGGAAQDVLAADADNDREIHVWAVATEAAAGAPDFDLGCEDGTVKEVFEDISAGAWALGDRWYGSCNLPKGKKLQCAVAAAGTAGKIKFYVLPIVIKVQTAQLLDDAVTTLKIIDDAVTAPKLPDNVFDATAVAAKFVNPPSDDPGHLANGVLRVSGNVADGETVTIGTDVFEVDVINTDSTDDTADGSWNNTTDPLTVDLTTYTNLDGVIGLGDLILIGTEILRVTVIDGHDYTFARGQCGTTTAVHADAVNILISDAPHAGGTTDIQVGPATVLTPAWFTPAIAADINGDVGAADQSGLLSATSLEAAGVLLLATEDPAASVLATTETGGNLAFDQTTLKRGAATARKRMCCISVVPQAEEDTADKLYVPLPFDAAIVLVQVRTTADGTQELWDGKATIVAASPPAPCYVLLDNSGAVDWATTSTVYIIAIE